MNPFVTSVTAVCCALVYSSLQVHASAVQQSGPGAIRGVVVDSTGAVVPDARVALTRDDTAVQSDTTDQRGAYAFDGLQMGDYSVIVKAGGFASITRQVAITGVSPVVVDVSLELASMNYAVSVTAARADKPLIEVPGAVGIVSQSSIQRARPQVSLDEGLPRLPGVFTQNRYNFSSDLRISIRGFGSRTPFGIRGIKLLMDGIPETLPDGQGEVDAMDLGSADRIEVIRGPASSLYGNASGGVINVITESGTATPLVDARIAAGGYGYQKYQIKASGQAQRLNYLVSGSKLELEGHRPHSRTENVLLNGKFAFTLGARDALTIVATFVDAPKADNPGALTAAQLEGDRFQANPQNVLFNAGEEVRQTRVGATYRRGLRADQQVAFTGYYMFRDLSNRGGFRDEGVVLRGRYFVGGGVKYINQHAMLGRPNRVIAGLDAEYQHDDRQRYHNELGQAGPLTFDQIETVGNVAPFVQNELSLHDRLELTVGARYDRLPFGVEDRFQSDGDQSGHRILSQFSPKFGLRYLIRSGLSGYGNISTSFETPTTTELTNPLGGGFVPDLEPQTAVNYELGVKGGAAVLDWEFSVFRVNVKDELVPFELPQTPGRDYFRNAGASVRHGVEAAAAIRPVKDVTLSTAYTYSDFKFTSFSVGGATFDGRRIPGIPRHLVFGEIAYASAVTGLFGAWETTYQGTMFGNNANTVTVGSQLVSNLRAGWNKRLSNWSLGPFVGINNLFDALNISNVNINAFGGRYFEPGPSRNAYGGLTIGYAFSGKQANDGR